MPLHGAQPRCFQLITHATSFSSPPRRQQRQSVPNIGIILKPQRILDCTHVTRRYPRQLNLRALYRFYTARIASNVSPQRFLGACVYRYVCVCVKKMQAAAERLLPPLRLLLPTRRRGRRAANDATSCTACLSRAVLRVKIRSCSQPPPRTLYYTRPAAVPQF